MTLVTSINNFKLFSVSDLQKVNFLLVIFLHLDCTQCNEIKTYFCRAQKHVASRIGTPLTTCLQGYTKKIGYISDYGWKWLNVQVVLCTFEINLI